MKSYVLEVHHYFSLRTKARPLATSWKAQNHLPSRKDFLQQALGFFQWRIKTKRQVKPLALRRRSQNILSRQAQQFLRAQIQFIKKQPLQLALQMSAKAKVQTMKAGLGKKSRW